MGAKFRRIFEEKPGKYMDAQKPSQGILYDGLNSRRHYRLDTILTQIAAVEE
jgi:hypothetical protein